MVLSDLEQLNALAAEQQVLGESVSKYVIELGQAKTRTQSSNIRSKLDAVWEQFKSNHNECLRFQQALSTHSYFKDLFFNTVETLYMNADKTPPPNGGNTDNLNIITNQTNASSAPQLNPIMWRFEMYIEELADNLDQANMYLSNTDSPETLQMVQHSVDAIEQLWQLTQSTHFEIIGNPQLSVDYDRNVYRTFSSNVQKLKSALSRLKLQAQATRSTIRPNIALPQVVIPMFDGSFKKWVEFKEIFQRIIHENPALTGIERFQYLKTHVMGDAAKLIQNLPFSESNYEEAWKTLVDRYHNKRLLLHQLLDAILDQPSCRSDNASDLKNLHDTTKEKLKAITNLGFSTTSWGPIIGRIVTRKWDHETNKLYEQSITRPHEVQEIQETLSFLEKRFLSLEGMQSHTKSHPHLVQHQLPSGKKVYSQLAYQPNMPTVISCNICGNNHRTYTCSLLKSLSPADRLKKAMMKSLCINCLQNHGTAECPSIRRCMTCGAAHHTLLHPEEKPEGLKPHPPKPNNFKKGFSKGSHAVTGQDNENVVLATALVQIPSAAGTPLLARVLLDQGSQASFITERLAQLIGLPRQKAQATISGVGNTTVQTSKWVIDTHLSPRFPSDFKLNTVLHVLPKLTGSVPSTPLPEDLVDSEDKNYIADPTFNRPGPIDILLGAHHVSQIIRDGLKKKNTLLSQNTEFGWALSGSIRNNINSIGEVKSMVAKIQEQCQLQRFWEIEEIQNVKPLSTEDLRCEQLYEKTTIRNEDGTYTVRLPMRDHAFLGESKPKAAARFLQLERKFLRQPEFKAEYCQFIDEYQDLNHMVPSKENEENGYFIPHHAVIREDSTTTKLRVVFDASSKTDINISLNSQMYVGPQLQTDLADILLRWRKHKIVFSADIEKMFRQIKMHPDDQKYQQVLWRPNQHQPLLTYKLTTVTYGTAAAPYLAIRTLRQLCHDEEQTYPEAAKIVRSDIYVDDILSGANDPEKAIELQTQLMMLLKSGGFNLRKWASNNKKLIESLQPELRQQANVEFTQPDSIKSLGVFWNPNEDAFFFGFKPLGKLTYTKRAILSEISKLFDPLGWLAPVTISIKLLIQELWSEGKDWDQEVSEKHKQQWARFNDEFNQLGRLNIPRWIGTQDSSIELHGFCDASEKAYGAVVYSKVILNGVPKITLLEAKSKVAPLKTKATLPRLELCAACLLANLVEKVVSALQMTTVNIFTWSDSTIALHWIAGSPQKWDTFVSNRVAQIQQRLPNTEWNHVASEDNPADIISRGLPPSQLQQHLLWWQGPKWLQYPAEEWPRTKLKPEMVPDVTCNAAISNSTLDDTLIRRFSSLSRMIRVLSYCRRFKSKLKGQVKFPEMANTMTALIRNVQQQHYKTEYSALQQNKVLNKASSILIFNPFLDDDQIMRVGGRLRNSKLSFNQKHPILLPTTHALTKLIIAEAHQTNLHSGVEATLSYIRRKYWIPNVKRSIRTVVKNCVTCIRHQATTIHQLMGDLPEQRVTPSFPFTHTGVDYAGPIFLKTAKGRGHKSYKGYLAVFVCMATKAIHLEVVSDMSTNSFLAAFKRFTSRRGSCQHLYSDNGTTFVRGAKELRKEIQQVENSAEVQGAAAKTGVEWHFIPAFSPHFGGLWEAGVKSTKHHLVRVIGETKLTFEEMTTLLCQIEACLNSRPLCSVSNVDTELEILTPGHFLIGRPIVEPPNPIDTEINNSVAENWRLIHKIKQDFWKSWSSEYLNRLQQRYKWNQPANNVTKGTVVIIKEDNINPCQWPLALIEETHPGPDGMVRAVTVKKPNGGTSTRTITKLIPLPQGDDQDEPVEKKKRHCEHAYRKTQPARSGSVVSWVLALLTLCAVSSEASFSINKPEGGLFLEHLGETHINRGVFRLEVLQEKSKLKENVDSIQSIMESFKKLCNEPNLTTANMTKIQIGCDYRLSYLQEEIHQLNQIHEAVMSTSKSRTKRGLLGKFMTSVFGVNDEVYQQIDTLNTNQEKLIKASHQQTKIMLTTINKINSTEAKIYHKFNLLRTQLHTSMAEVKKLQDEIQGHSLIELTFQRIEAYIHQITEQQKKLLEVETSQTNFFGISSPLEVTKVVTQIKTRLPANIEVVKEVLWKTTTSSNSTHISIFGHFPLVDASTYMLVKATPTPISMSNQTYTTVDIQDQILAVNYNSQQYFELTETEYRSCTPISTLTHICSPVVIKNLQSNPNCIIKEMFQRTDSCNHTTVTRQMGSIIWKQLMTPNSWMFLSPKNITIGVICGGERTDAHLFEFGIIHIGDHCAIHSEKNILLATRTDSLTVQAVYTRTIHLNATLPKTAQPTEFKEEPVLKSQDSFGKEWSMINSLAEDEENTTWRKLSNKHHVTTTYILMVGAYLIIFFSISFLTINRYRHRRSNRGNLVPTTVMPEEMYQMRPLRVGGPPICLS